MATFVDVPNKEGCQVNLDTLVFIEKTEDEKYKHYFISGLTLLLDNPLVEE